MEYGLMKKIFSKKTSVVRLVYSPVALAVSMVFICG
ncbi:usher protein, partial [Salmonella enterica subsp. enterica serovar Anatum]|nr:usher protein [Salmonella enterica subsp. enterica serovar Anatum]